MRELSVRGTFRLSVSLSPVRCERKSGDPHGLFKLVTSKALVTRSDALVPSSFLLLVCSQRHRPVFPEFRRHGRPMRKTTHLPKPSAPGAKTTKDKEMTERRQSKWQALELNKVHIDHLRASSWMANFLGLQNMNGVGALRARLNLQSPPRTATQRPL